MLVNVGSGFNIAGRDNLHPIPAPPSLTERILVRDNVIGVTGLNGADGRAFQFVAGGGDYTVDHNTIINSALRPAFTNSDLAMAESKPTKVSQFRVHQQSLDADRLGLFGSGVGEGAPALNKYFTNWRFSRNVLVARPAGAYPAGNFFPASVAGVRFVNYAAGNYALAANSPYRNAATDGTDIGAK